MVILEDNSGVIDKIIRYESLELQKRRAAVWEGFKVNDDRAETDAVTQNT